jgi:hypothetical protein
MKPNNCKSSIGNWKWQIGLATLLALSGFAVSTKSQSFELDWFTIDGGGGASTGGVYAVSGTIGQPDAGVMGGGQYLLVGGFWGVVAIQTPGAPLLSIEQMPSGGLRVFWPVQGTGFVLHQTPTLTGSPAPWTQVAFPYQTNATQIYITLPAPSGNQFYRLRKP